MTLLTELETKKKITQNQGEGPRLNSWVDVKSSPGKLPLKFSNWPWGIYRFLTAVQACFLDD